MVKVYSMPNCGKCNSAKDKLRMFGINYEELPYGHYVNYHNGWDDDGSIDVIVARNYYGDHAVPLIQDEDGRVYDYPGYMKIIKQNRKQHAN